MKLAPDVLQGLHDGMIAALMHMASARGPGSTALAIEFDAAQRVIQATMPSLTSAADLQHAFVAGLSLQTLKLAQQKHLAGDRRLLDLQRREVIAAMNFQQRADYRALVLAAAEAALHARIEDDPLRLRTSVWERVALEEIRHVFENGLWDASQSH